MRDVNIHDSNSIREILGGNLYRNHNRFIIKQDCSYQGEALNIPTAFKVMEQ